MGEKKVKKIIKRIVKLDEYDSKKIYLPYWICLPEGKEIQAIVLYEQDDLNQIYYILDVQIDNNDYKGIIVSNGKKVGQVLAHFFRDEAGDSVTLYIHIF